MSERPELNKKLDAATFRSFYYLKQELADFCKENGLPTSGSKAELTDRIAYFLDTGNVLKSSAERKTSVNIGTLTEDAVIEPNIVCSEKHRAFFREKIGKSFSFNVPFQKWLKTNAGKTYGDAIRAYNRILSGGERQRLFIVLALIPQPELVFLDELTTGLDAKARRSVWETLEHLMQRGLTIFLTSHFMDEVEALCDEICILKKGTPVFRGTVEQAKAQCGCERFEDAYLQLSDEEVDA